MDVSSIISVIIFLVYLEFGLYVFFKNRSSKLNRSFFYLCLGLAVWVFSFVCIFSCENTDGVAIWFKVGSIGWCLIPALMIRFKFYLTGFPEKHRLKDYLFAIFLLPGLFFLYLIFTENWILFDMEEYRRLGMLVYDKSTDYFYYYLAYLYFFFALIFFMLIRWRKNMKEKNEKTLFLIIVTTFLISILWITVTEIALPLVYDKPFLLATHMASFVYVAGLFYSLIKFKLFKVTPSLVANKIVDELKEILIFTDTKTRILKINHHTVRLMGYKMSDIYGEKLKIMFSDEQLLDKNFKKVVKGNGSILMDTRLKSLTGSLIPVKLYLLVIKDEFGDIFGYAVHGYDNRDAIKLEEELEKKKQTELKLKDTGNILERLVRERTSELESSYKKLQIEIADRMRVEEKIKADISEKEVLINEIYNRVISNMHMIISLISTQASRGMSESVKLKFQELNQRIKSMLLVHDNLYLSINYSDVDFARFLNIITNDLSKLYNKNKKIAVKSTVCDVFLNIDYAIPLGLIANELITNAFLHAFPRSYFVEGETLKPTIFINYSFDGEYYYFIVRDNGSGLPGRFNIEELKTTGMQLVDILVKDQIGGKWDILSDGGTLVKVVFCSEK